MSKIVFSLFDDRFRGISRAKDVIDKPQDVRLPGVRSAIDNIEPSHEIDDRWLALRATDDEESQLHG